jgi:hypothetical protein
MKIYTLLNTIDMKEFPGQKRVRGMEIFTPIVWSYGNSPGLSGSRVGLGRAISSSLRVNLVGCLGNDSVRLIGRQPLGVY